MIKPNANIRRYWNRTSYFPTNIYSTAIATHMDTAVSCQTNIFGAYSSVYLHGAVCIAKWCVNKKTMKIPDGAFCNYINRLLCPNTHAWTSIFGSKSSILCILCVGFGFVAHKTLSEPKRNDVDALL